MTTTASEIIRSGDVVEFVTSYPGHEGQTVHGRVLWSPHESRIPGNLDVAVPFGRIEIQARRVTKIASSVAYIYQGNRT